MISQTDIDDMSERDHTARAACSLDETLAGATANAADACNHLPSQDMAGDERVAHLKQAAREMIEGYDWWKVDTFDRCQSVLVDCVDDLRAALSAMDTPAQGGGDERVARLVEAAREAEFDLSEWFECRGELIKAGFNMDGTEGIRDRLRAALAAMDTPKGDGDE